jgi:protein phosphatase
VAAAVIGYQFTQTRYYVGVDNGEVAIFQGVQQDIGPIKLSHVVEATTIGVDELSAFNRQSVEATISANNLSDAHRIVDRLTG